MSLTYIQLFYSIENRLILFLSLFQPEDTPEPSDGDLPKCDSTYSIDIPHSETIWEAEPRPPNTAEVNDFTDFIERRKKIEI